MNESYLHIIEFVALGHLRITILPSFHMECGVLTRMYK